MDHFRTSLCYNLNSVGISVSIKCRHRLKPGLILVYFQDLVSSIFDLDATNEIGRFKVSYLGLDVLKHFEVDFIALVLTIYELDRIAASKQIGN